MNETKTSNKDNKIFIYEEIYALINKVDPNIKIKEVNKSKINAYVNLSKYPYIIVLSAGLLKNETLTVNDIKVVIAHELGHVEFKDELERSQKPIIYYMILLTIFIYFIWYLEFLIIIAIALTLIMTIAIIICLHQYRKIRHNHEYKADSFVFSEKMSISLKAFEECLHKTSLILEEEYTSEVFLIASIIKFRRALTHPTIDQRISIARNFYKTINR